ncbi:unnamed protein product [Urochloa decumbens]|uniref:F-box protein AT5G49610-like beta-propeller domain-containing protein n=1 Tax=Urochloa decumbens TaxID=240449 RepID=A0ABC9CED8_9POAL
MEILLRLPPVPSSLPRVQALPPPILGFFDGFSNALFNPTLDTPDRVPSACLFRQALRRDDRDIYKFLGYRHGLALILNRTRLEVTVWDPVSGDHRRVAVPPFCNENTSLVVRNGALLCDDGGHDGMVPLEAFKVILVRHDWPVAENSTAFACLYEAQTSVWCDLISTPIKAPVSMRNPSILVGNSLCWLLHGYDNGGILEFCLGKRSLAVIKHPVDAHFTEDSDIQILRLEDSRLGLAILSGATIQLWVRKPYTSNVSRWLLQKTIDLDELLSLRSPVERSWHDLMGYNEDGHVIFISRAFQVFMIQLKSMQFRKLFESHVITTYHPYTCFYVTGRTIGSGDAKAETLNITATGSGDTETQTLNIK